MMLSNFNLGLNRGLELTLAIASAVFALTLTLLFLKNDPERPAQATIAVPEQCEEEWVGQALEKPGIKVIRHITRSFKFSQANRITSGARVKRNSVLLPSKWEAAGVH